MGIEMELDPEHMAQVRAIVISICENRYPEINIEKVKFASNFVIKRIWHVVMGRPYETRELKLIDLKRIVD